jgi:hypothetical protein
MTSLRTVDSCDPDRNRNGLLRDLKMAAWRTVTPVAPIALTSSPYSILYRRLDARHAHESAGLKKSGQFFQSDITYRLDVLAIEVIHIGPFFPVLTILFPRMPHMQNPG